MWCRVLLVDDEARILSALRRELMRKPEIGYDGLEVEAFVSPTEALARVADESSEFDIAIVDYMMPGLDGISFLKTLHRLQPRTIRILLTGCADSEAAISAINDAQVDFLVTKPWSEYDLKGRIALALHERELRSNRTTLPAPRSEPYRLMLVDDDAPLLNALEREITRGGIASRGSRPLFAIEKFTQPAQALAAAADVCPDLVLSDFAMPGMDGVTLLHRLRDLRPDAVRVMMSAQEDIGVLIDAINVAGVYHFLGKPWEPANLEATLRQALRYRDLLTAEEHN